MKKVIIFLTILANLYGFWGGGGSSDDSSNSSCEVKDGIVVVDDDGNECNTECKSIKDALGVVNDGDKIVVCKGEYSDTLDITKAVTIEGNLSSGDIDNIHQTSRVNIKADGVTLKNFFIDYNYEAIAIENDTISATIDNMHVKGGKALYITNAKDVNVTNSKLESKYENIYITSGKIHNLYINDTNISADGKAIFLKEVNDANITNTLISSGDVGVLFADDGDGHDINLSNVTIKAKNQAILLKNVNDANIKDCEINSTDSDAIVFGDKKGHDLTISDSAINGNDHGIFITNANNAYIYNTNTTVTTYEGLLFGCKSGNKLIVDGSYFYKKEDSKDPSNVIIVRGSAKIKNTKIIDKETVGLLISLNTSQTCDTDVKVDRVDIINSEIQADKKEALFANNVDTLNLKYSTITAPDATNGAIYIEDAKKIYFYDNKIDSGDSVYGVNIKTTNLDDSYIYKTIFNKDKTGKDFYSKNDKLLLRYNCFYGNEIDSLIDEGDKTGFDRNFYYDVNDTNNNGAIDAGDSDKIKDKVNDDHYLKACNVIPECELFKSALYSFKRIQFNSGQACNSPVVYSDESDKVNDNFTCSDNLECSDETTCEVKPLNSLPYIPDLLSSDESYSIDNDCDYDNGKCYLTHTNYKTNTNDFNNKTPEVITFEATEECEGNRNEKCMTLGDMTLQNKTFTLKFKPGNYYFKSLNINSDTTIELPEGGSVKIFVENNDFKIRGDINKDGNSTDLFIYTHGNILVEKESTVKAYIYTASDFNANNDITLYGALETEGNMGGKGTYIYTGFPGSIFPQCLSSSSASGGFYDIYDVDKSDKENNANGKIGDISAEDRNITTKIVGQKFDLIFASLDTDNETLKVHTNKDGNNIYIKYGIASCSAPDSSDCKEVYKSDEVVFDKKEINKNFTISQPVRYAAAFVEACVIKNDNNVTFYSYDDCNNNTDCSDNKKCLVKFYSTDKFAIRPAKFTININSPIITADNFNITLKALDENNNTVKNYNDLVSLNDGNVTIEIKEKKDNCYTGDLSFEDKNFIDGEAEINAKYSEIGEVNFTVKEVEGKEFAKIDMDDTPDEKRFITPETIEVKFLPYSFKIEGNYNDFKDNFTYLSNDLNMSSKLNLTLTAVNKDNNTTKNYKKECYSKDVNVTLKHNTDLNSDTIIALIYDTNYFSKDDPIKFTLKKEDFNDGKIEKTIKINLKKDYKKPVEPFELTITEIEAKDENTSGKNDSFNQTAHFIYGYLFVKSVGVYNSKEAKTEGIFYKYQNGWIKNKNHTTEFGDINISNSYYPDNIELSQNTINEGKETLTIKTTHSIPYKAKIHLSIPSWLWHHPLAKEYKDPSKNNLDCLTHRCFNTSFKLISSGWSGIGQESKKYNEKNATTNVTLKQETNESKVEVKKLYW